VEADLIRQPVLVAVADRHEDVGRN